MTATCIGIGTGLEIPSWVAEDSLLADARDLGEVAYGCRLKIANENRLDDKKKKADKKTQRRAKIEF